jgi:predicted small metal-binding protein
MGLKVFDIITEKELNEIPERILANCKPVKMVQLIRNNKEAQRTIELEPRQDKKLPASLLTINIAGLNDEEIVQKIAEEALAIHGITTNKDLPLNEILSNLRRKNIAVALQTVSFDDYFRAMKPESKKE